MVDTSGDHAEIGAHVIERHIGLNAAHHYEPAQIVVAQVIAAWIEHTLHGDRRPEIDDDGLSSLKARRSDADHSEVGSVESDRLTDDRWVGAERAAPDTVGQHSHSGRAGSGAIRSNKAASERGPRA